MSTPSNPSPDPKRRRKEIKEKFVNVVTEARVSKICLYCSNIGHSMDECEVPGVAAVRRSLAHVQAKLTEVEDDVVADSSTKADVAMSSGGPSTSSTAEEKPPQNRWSIPKPMSRFSKEWIKERMNSQMAEVIYMTPVPLEVISNRNEGGSLKIEHIDPTQVGLSDHKALDDFLKSLGETREIFDSPKTLMKEIVEVCHLINNQGKGSKGKSNEDNTGKHPMYYPIDPKNDYGQIQIIPDTGVNYFSKPWWDAVIYDPHSRCPKEDYRLSKLLCAILRHDVGKQVNRKGHPGTKCDEGAWVNITEILYNDNIWKEGQKVRDRYGDVTNQETVVIRYNKLLGCMFYERAVNGRMRFQIAALRVQNMEEQTVKNLIDRDLLDPKEIRKCDGWAYPVAVRCPYGHSGAIDASGSVHLDQSRICYPIPKFLTEKIGGCYHVTTWDVLEGIMENGITRGGARGGQHRLGVYFSLFAPCDERSRSGPKKIYEAKKLPGKRVVIHVPLRELQKLDTYVSAAGSVLTFADIPLRTVQGMWHETYKGEWHRLMLKDGEKQLITQCMNPMYVAKTEKLMSRITEYLGNKNGNKEHYNFIKGMKEKIDKGEIKLHPDREEWGDIVARLTLNHTPSVAGRILCPACLCETFPSVVICIRCQGSLISQGVRQFVVPEAVRSTARRTPSPERERIIQELNGVVEIIDITDDDDTKTEYVEEIEMEKPPKDYFKEKAAEEDEWNENRKKAYAIEEKEKKDGDAETDNSQPNWLGSQEATDSIPKWALPIPVAVCELPITNATNADTSAKNAELMDIALFGYMKGIYKLFRKKMIEMTRESFVAMAMSTNPNQRQDYNGKWPLLVDPTTEMLRDPSSEEEWDLCLKLGGKNAGTLEDIQSKYRGAKLMYSLCLALAKAGVSLEELSEHGGQQTQDLDRDRYTDDEVAQVRRKTSQFMGRVIAQAFNVRTYAYFRQDIDWSSHVMLNAVDIMNFPKDEKRYVNPLVVIANAGMQMTPKLKKQYQDYVHHIRQNAGEKTIAMATRFIDNESANKMLGYVAPTAKSKASEKSSSSRPGKEMDNMD